MSSELKNLKKYINFTNSTSTFRNLMHKYKNKLKISRDLNKDIIMNQIYSNIKKIENDERENDYIISEVRRNAQIDKEILYSFGTKALNHLNEVIKVNVTTKVDKNKFLGIAGKKNKKKLKNNREKQLFYNKSKLDYKNKDNRFIILPKIIIKNKHPKQKYQNEYSIIKNKTEHNLHYYNNDENNKSISLPKNKRKSFNNNYNFSRFRKGQSTEFNTNSIKELTPIKKRKEKSNDSIILINPPLLTDRNRKESAKIDIDYINYIRTIGNQFSETEKKQERYFYNNKYGVDAFKIRYNYLTKKFFN